MLTRRRDAPPPRTGGSEIETLRGFLDYLRGSIATIDGSTGAESGSVPTRDARRDAPGQVSLRSECTRSTEQFVPRKVSRTPALRSCCTSSPSSAEAMTS